jgi:site-specific DNA-methyltransferase (adenine-specific)
MRQVKSHKSTTQERMIMLQSGFYNMDCMDGMAQFPDKYFELAIVDPPYGIGVFTCNAWYKDGKKTLNSKVYTDDYTWNNSIPQEKYFTELKRVSKNRIIWGANYYNCFENGNGAIVWYKGDATLTISRCEIASLSFQKKVEYVHIDWQSGFYRKLTEGEQVHPCQKPVKLYEWLLSHYAKQGDKILDTHVGSASSLIACHNMGFEYWGFELDEDYYKAANERLNAVKAQMKLW